MENKMDFYNELRNKIKNNMGKISENDKLPEVLLFAPDIFYLLINLLKDPEVPKAKKVKLGVVVAYFITPFDLLPEALIGFFGYIDDIALSAFVLNDLVNGINPEIIKRHWPGEDNILDVIQKILNDYDKFINKNVINRLKKLIDK
ncbi:MAG: YkvA family protein [Bacillota bacterium]